VNRRDFLQLSVLGITSVFSRRLMASERKPNILFIQPIYGLQSVTNSDNDRVAAVHNRHIQQWTMVAACSA
jgi:hypothetical protein